MFAKQKRKSKVEYPSQSAWITREKTDFTYQQNEQYHETCEAPSEEKKEISSLKSEIKGQNKFIAYLIDQNEILNRSNAKMKKLIPNEEEKVMKSFDNKSIDDEDDFTSYKETISLKHQLDFEKRKNVTLEKTYEDAIVQKHKDIIKLRSEIKDMKLQEKKQIKDFTTDLQEVREACEEMKRKYQTLKNLHKEAVEQYERIIKKKQNEINKYEDVFDEVIATINKSYGSSLRQKYGLKNELSTPTMNIQSDHFFSKIHDFTQAEEIRKNEYDLTPSEEVEKNEYDLTPPVEVERNAYDLTPPEEVEKNEYDLTSLEEFVMESGIELGEIESYYSDSSNI